MRRIFSQAFNIVFDILPHSGRLGEALHYERKDRGILEEGLGT